MLEQLEITENGYFSEKEAQTMIEQVVQALARIHAFEAIHKNIKFESIGTVIDDEGNGAVIILDNSHQEYGSSSPDLTTRRLKTRRALLYVLQSNLSSFI